MHIFVSCLLPRDDEKSVKISLLYAANCYLKKYCTNQLHYINLDSGWTLNNHLNTELFRSDNLHLNRKGYEKLSKLFISKIESLQIILQRQNLKASRNYTEGVSFSIVDDQFSPLLSGYRTFSKPVCSLNVCKPLPPVNPSKDICSFNFNETYNSCKPVRPVDFSNPVSAVDGLRSIRHVIFSKSVRPVNALKLVRSVNFNKIACTVNSNKPGHPVNPSTIVRPVNSSNFLSPVDIRTVDSNKPLSPVNSRKPVRPVDVRNPICPVNSNEIIRTVNSNKPANSKIARPVNSSKPVSPGILVNLFVLLMFVNLYVL